MPKPSFPKSAQKRLYRHPSGLPKSVGVILIGYCPDTLAYFEMMFTEAKKTFTKLKQEYVTCSKVRESASIQGFTVILFDVEVADWMNTADWERWDRCVDFRF